MSTTKEIQFAQSESEIVSNSNRNRRIRSPKKRNKFLQMKSKLDTTIEQFRQRKIESRRKKRNSLTVSFENDTYFDEDGSIHPVLGAADFGSDIFKQGIRMEPEGPYAFDVHDQVHSSFRNRRRSKSPPIKMYGDYVCHESENPNSFHDNDVDNPYHYRYQTTVDQNERISGKLCGLAHKLPDKIVNEINEFAGIRSDNVEYAIQKSQERRKKKNLRRKQARCHALQTKKIGFRNSMNRILKNQIVLVKNGITPEQFHEARKRKYECHIIDSRIENQGSFTGRFINGAIAGALTGTPHDNADIIKLVEQVTVSVMAITMCKSYKHMLLVIYSQLSLFTNKSLVTIAYDAIVNIFESAGIQNQSADEYGDWIDLLTHNWKLLVKGSLAKHIKKVLAIVTCVGVFSTDKSFNFGIFTSIFEAFEKITSAAPDCVSWIIEFALFLLGRGLQVWKTGDIRALFFDEPKLLSFEKRITEVKYRFDLFQMGHGHKERVQLSELDIEIRNLIDDVDKLYVSMTTSYEKLSVASKLAKLKSMKAEVTSLMKNVTSRRAPYAFALTGGTSRGKSTLQMILAGKIARSNHVPFDKESVLSMNASDKYQSELKTNHRTIILDDFNNTKAEKAEGNAVELVMKMVNNNPQVALKPDIESKGKMPMHPDIVVISANDPNMEIASYSNCPPSFFRRFDMIIDVTVRDEYSKHDGMLDEEKLMDPIGDYWTFTVRFCMPVALKDYTLALMCHEGVELENIGLEQLLQVMEARSKAHFDRQDKLLNAISDMHSIELCEHGSYPTICSRCKVVDQMGIDVWRNTKNYMSEDALQEFWTKLLMMLNNNQWLMWMFQQIVPRFCYCEEDLVLILPRWWAYFFRFFIGWIVFGIFSVYCMFPFAILTLAANVAMGFSIAAIYATCMWVNAMRSLLIRLPMHIAMKSYRKMQQHKYQLGTLVATLTTFYAIWKVYKCYDKIQIEDQGNAVKRPVPDANFTENRWVKPEMYPVEVGLKARTSTMHQLDAKVKSVLSRVRIVYSSGESGYCNIFPMSHGVWILPKHMLSRGNDVPVQLQIYRTGDMDKMGCGPNFISLYGEDIVYHIPDTDLSAIYLIKGGPLCDFTDYLPNNSIVGNGFSSSISYRQKDNTFHTERFHAKGIFMDVNDHHHDAMSYTLKDISTQSGMCTSVIISEGKYPFISGFHVAGDRYNGYACTLYQDQYKEACRELFSRSLPVKLATVEHYDLRDAEFALDHLKSIPETSPANFLEDGSSFNHLGHHDGSRRTFRSNVAESMISEDVMDQFGVENKYGKPQIKGWFPWHSFLQKASKAEELSPFFLKKAFDDFQGGIMDFLNRNVELKDKIHPLDHLSILSGVNGCKYIDALKLRTSAGWPYNKPKDHYMSRLTLDEKLEVDCENIEDPLDFDDPIFMERINQAEKDLARGVRVNFINRANLKDEPKKKGSKKVRVFAGANIFCTYLLRKYFLTMTKVIQENPEVFECAVGTNATGSEWTQVANLIKKYGATRCIAGDFEAYDTRIANQVTILAFKILIAIAEWAGYTPEQLTIMRGLATELTSVILEFNGEYILFNAINPSGHGLTVFVNDLVNSIYLRFAYHWLKYEFIMTQKYLEYPESHIPVIQNDFRSHVSLVTYGDDNAMSVSETCPWFNHTDISRCLANYGIVYTMAEKDAQSIAYVHFNDISFLKRRFVWNEELKNFLGPLDKESIFKSLHCIVKTKAISDKQQIAQVIDSANREFWYHGREVFEDAHKKLCYIFSKHDLEHELPRPLASYEELKENYA